MKPDDIPSQPAGPANPLVPMPRWDQIDAVLLDMDGTLLDLHFDNHFWQVHVPGCYATARGLNFNAACNEIFPHMLEICGTLNWYDIHYWSEWLQLDIPALKLEVSHLIMLRPGVIELLKGLHDMDKTLVLATNAHQDTVEIKFARVNIGSWFHHVISSDQVGAPKEQPGYWQAMESTLGIKPADCLLIDDNQAVLDAARAYGIGNLLTIEQPDLAAPAQADNGYPAIAHFSQIMP